MNIIIINNPHKSIYRIVRSNKTYFCRTEVTFLSFLHYSENLHLVNTWVTHVRLQFER